MGAIFGTAGNSEVFLNTISSESADAPAWLKSIGLDAFEYQCGRGVRIRPAAAQKIGENARAAGITLSLHAPYFINPANPTEESLQKNLGHVLAACRAAEDLGAQRIVVHAGAIMKRPREEALTVAVDSFRTMRRVCDEKGFENIILCPETMGKINQLGDLEEVLAICAAVERTLPCVDFGHLYARSLGAEDGAEADRRMLDRMAEVLGEERASRFHSHFSKIEFTEKGGEARHLRFEDPGWGPDCVPLMEEVARRGWSPTFICESAGTQSEDALTMKKAYLDALGRLS